LVLHYRIYERRRMTKEETLQAVQEIKDIASDDDMAHDLEEALRERFIAFVAERNDELGEVARIIFQSTCDISSVRYWSKPAAEPT